MSTVEILSDNVVEVSVEPSPVIEVEVQPNSVVDVEVLPGGITYGGVLSLDYQLILGRLINQPTLHKVLSYSSGNLTQIDVYSDDTLSNQLLSIVYNYTDNSLTQKVLTDLVSGRVLTIDYNYTSDNLTSINEVFS